MEITEQKENEMLMKCIENNKPQRISCVEICQIFDLKVVQESWGLEEETKKDYNKALLRWQAMTYIVKFNFQSDSSGYCGPMYLLHGDDIVGPAITIIQDQKLIDIDFSKED